MSARRTVAITTTEESVPSIVVPRGRTAAEHRLGAIAALHQPIPRHYSGSYAGGVTLQEPETVYVCGECKTPAARPYDGVVPARWPCATARLMGPWPGGEPNG